ncbi:MAG: S9 family peptidase [Planctomycetota bacterium]
MTLTTPRALAAAFAAVLATLAAAAAQQPTPLEPVTEAQALNPRNRIEWFTTPSRVRWAPDGVHYVRRADGKTEWIDPATGAATAPARDAEPREAAAPPRRRGARSPLRLIEDDLYFGKPRAKKDEMRRLTSDGAAKRVPTLSADQRRAAFVREGNLAVIDVASGEEWAVSSDGSEDLLYGVLDWVYQEEVYGRGDFQGHWWRDDGAALAFLRLDESPVKSFTLVDFVPTPKLDDERSVEPEVMRYPKAGDSNPTASLHVAWIDTKKIVDVDLAGYAPDVLLVRVGWAPDGRLLAMVQDRIQTWLDLCAVDPETGTLTKLVHEESDSWVNRMPFPTWLDDGTFLWMSERTGYQHVYHYTADGKLLRAVTEGDWQVRNIVRRAEVDGELWLWFTGTKDGAIDDNLYRASIKGGEPQRLTEGPGRHSVSLNGDASWFIDTVSSIETPTEVRLCKGDGSGFTVLDKAEPTGAKKYVYAPKRRLTIAARDEYPLDATLILPPRQDAGARKHPIYLQTYSGPDAPTVRNSFRVSSWQQFLAQQGCILLQVNVRSASGRGQAHTGLCYKQLGVQELRDLEDAVAHVVAKHRGDPDRVAIDGWSYGGFMAAYALTHSDKFSLGIAGAGVHDWQLYDTIYTERYMDTPQSNPDGYAKTSVIAAADQLHGHLVLMHGARDDNVHLQNTMRLVYELQKAGKDDFELMIYPRSRHGVRSPHRQRYIWRAIREHLLP